MTGEDFFLVVSNGGTRQQVSFLIEGKAPKGLRKHVGQTLQVTGVVDKTSGWGGRIEAENFEPRPPEFRASRARPWRWSHIEGEVPRTAVEVKLNHGLTVRLPEQPGLHLGHRAHAGQARGSARGQLRAGQPAAPATREFFFTPRNPGSFEVEFFLAKAFTPARGGAPFKINVTVKP